MTTENKQEYSLGLPKNSVRAIIALALTVGFIVLFLLAATEGLTSDNFLKLFAPYGAIYGIIINSYFQNRAEADRINGNGKRASPTET
jgi:hypothetical protein